MADRREDILSRLVAVCGAVDGILAVGRNRLDVDEMTRPAVVVLDGEEELVDPPQERGRGANRSGQQIMELSPVIVVAVRGGNGIEAGALLSRYRSAVLSAVLSDDLLLSAASSNGGVRYEGCSVPPPDAEGREHRIELNLIFTYPFRLSDLAAG